MRKCAVVLGLIAIFASAQLECKFDYQQIGRFAKPALVAIGTLDGAIILGIKAYKNYLQADRSKFESYTLRLGFASLVCVCVSLGYGKQVLDELEKTSGGKSLSKQLKKFFSR